MQKPRRYAEGTDVDVSKSQLDIKKLVTAHGATGFLIAEGINDGVIAGIVQFQVYGRMVKYERRYPSSKEMVIGQKRAQTKESLVRKREAEWRRRWRALFLIIKAKLETVASGDTTFEHEFLADIMLPEGGTVGKWLGPQITAAYDSGKMPNLLPSGD